MNEGISKTECPGITSIYFVNPFAVLIFPAEEINNNPQTAKGHNITVICDIMLPAVLAVTHTLTTYYIFSGLAVKGLKYVEESVDIMILCLLLSV